MKEMTLRYNPETEMWEEYTDPFATVGLSTEEDYNLFLEMVKFWQEHHKNIPNKDIYPLTVVCDRYAGAYSGGQYTAWNLDCSDVPEEINADDVTCMNFWYRDEKPYIIGIGDTLIEAVKDLENKLGGQYDD